MKLGFTPSIGFILDFECVVDCSVEWENGYAKLCVDNVFDSTGKVSILHSTGDKFWNEFGCRIAEEAEKCPRLLADAIAQWDDERDAA